MNQQTFQNNRVEENTDFLQRKQLFNIKPLQNMKLFLMFIGLSLFGALAGYGASGDKTAAFQVASNGKPNYTIVQAENSSKAEIFAALELSRYLKNITGADFKIVDGKQVLADMKGIYVGQTDFAQSKGINFKNLKREEWIIRTTDNGNLIIAGGRPRGTLYGVYEFLEKFTGCRWLDEDCEIIPSNPELRIPSVNIQDKPAFNLRSMITYRPVDTEKFALFHARNKYNYAYLDARLGFAQKFGSPGMCHTFYAYSENFPVNHPEYFSLDRNNNRLRAENGVGPGQVCLSNQQVRKLFINKLQEFIKQDKETARTSGWPAPLLYDISHNDNENKCVCENCMALENKYGAYSGALLDFINEIADAVKTDYPDIVIQTFAYTFTEQPPEGIKPRSNVMMRMAFLGPEFNHSRDTLRPLSHPNNSKAFNLIKKWSKIAENISVWDYWVIYREPFYSPYVNISSIQPDLKFYSQHGVKDILVESEYPETTSFFELKRWLGLKIMQNPKQSSEALVDDFMKHYYGKAAPAMKKYLNYLEKRMAEEKRKIGEVSTSQRTYLDMDFFKHSGALLDEAEKMAADNPEILPRIRQERITVDSALLNKWEQLKQQLPANQRMPFDKEKTLERYKQNLFVAIDKYVAPKRRQKRKTDESAKIEMLRMSISVPEQFRQEKIVDILWPYFAPVNYNHSGIELVSDSEATGQKAIKLGSKHARTSMPDFHMPPLTFGVYDTKTKKVGPSIRLDEKNIPLDEKYHLHKVGRAVISQDSLFWLHRSWRVQQSLASGHDRLDPENTCDVYVSLKIQGPSYIKDSKKENAVLMDRIILVKAKK